MSAFRFNIASKEPIAVEVAGKEYMFPRFSRRDWKDWKAEIDAQRLEAATAGLTQVESARLQLIYVLEPLTNADIQRRVYTYDGAERVFRACAEKAGVPEKELDAALDEADPWALETVAIMLASIVDPAEVAARMAEAGKAPEKAGKRDGKGKGGAIDPNDLAAEAAGGTGRQAEDDPDHPSTPKRGG